MRALSVALLLGLFASAGLSQATEPTSPGGTPAPTAPEAPTAPAGKAPGFTLRDLDNQEVRLADMEGKVTLLSFWATWCAPCMVELVHVERMYQTYKDQGFVVLAINADDARSTGRVKPLVKSKGWSFPVLLDPQTKVVSMYNPTKTLPYSELLNAQHEVIWRHQGYTPGDEVDLEKRVVEALAQLKVPAPAAP